MQAILEEAGTTMDNGKCWCIQSVFPMLYDLPVYTIFTLHVLLVSQLTLTITVIAMDVLWVVHRIPCHIYFVKQLTKQFVQ